jgi:hypothetical protein
MWENIVQPDRPCMTIRHMRTACCLPKAIYKHALRIRNTHCFSAATKVPQTRFNGTLNLQCLSCLSYNLLWRSPDWRSEWTQPYNIWKFVTTSDKLQLVPNSLCEYKLSSCGVTRRQHSSDNTVNLNIQLYENSSDGSWVVITHTRYIHTFHSSISVSQRYPDAEQITNTQIYEIYSIKSTINVLWNSVTDHIFTSQIHLQNKN